MVRAHRSARGIDFVARQGTVLYNWLQFSSLVYFNHWKENSLSAHRCFGGSGSVGPEQRLQSVGDLNFTTQQQGELR
jgi:hypothetical protein